MAITRFQISCHSLRIETGQYHHPQPLLVEESLCLKWWKMRYIVSWYALLKAFGRVI